MVNFGYVTSKQLRKNGILSELIMEKNPSQISDPLIFDSTLKDYPEWIHFIDMKKSSWKWNLIRKMRNQYDLIHADVEFPIFAYLSRKNFVAQTQGSDLRELSFSNSLKGILLRRAYHKAKAILFFQPDHYPLFKKLKLKNSIFLPPGGYTENFEPVEYDKNEYYDKFLIFHPSTLDWRLKGNDILIKGYAEFVKNNPDSMMIIVDRGIDSEKTHSLVTSLKINNHVKFLPGPLRPSELKKFYNLSDVVADHFAYGSLGSIGWEVLSSKKPLLAYIFQDLYKKLYGEAPPVVNAKTSKEITMQLESLKDPKVSTEVGKKSRSWITKYHSSDKYAKKLSTIYQNVIDNKNIDDIRYAVEKISY